MRLHQVAIMIFIFAVFIKLSNAELIINEIMYAPPGNFDDDLEWVEIFNNYSEESNHLAHRSVIDNFM